MATLVPDGSSWHQILKETAEKWKQASGGTRHGARSSPAAWPGDDPDVVRKMRLGTLNAGVLTSVGVAEIDKSRLRDGHPADVRLLRRGLLRPREDAAEARGEPRGQGLRGAQLGRRRLGALLREEARGRARRPARAEALLLGGRRRSRSRSGAPRASTRCRCPRPSSSTALQTGLVEALGSPPQVAVIAQYFNHATNMTDLRWQLLLGATLDHQGRLGEGPGRAAARSCWRSRASRARGCRRRSARRRQRDVEAMKKRGLTVVPVSAGAARAVAEAHREPLPEDPRNPSCRPKPSTRRCATATSTARADPPAASVSEAPAAAADGSLSAPPASAPARLLRAARARAPDRRARWRRRCCRSSTRSAGRSASTSPRGADYLQQVVLWLAFLGGLVATRERRHLTLSTAELFGETARRCGASAACWRRRWPRRRCGVLAYAAVGLVLANREEGRVLLGGVPVWLIECVMPAALGLMALRFAWAASRALASGACSGARGDPGRLRARRSPRSGSRAAPGRSRS